jgi:hypothetical protein
MQLRNDTGNTAYEGAGRLHHMIWHNKKFRSMSAQSQLVLVYLLAGPEFSPSGIFTVDLASIAGIGDMGGHLGAGLIMDALDERGLIQYDEPTCYIPGVRGFYSKLPIPGIQDQIDADVAKVLPGPVLDAYKEFYGLGDSLTKQHTDMTLALYDVMNVDATLDHPAIEAFAHDLASAGYTHEQVDILYGRGGWWYTQDWRGKKGNYPAIKSITETIKSASEGQVTEKKTGMDEELTKKVAKLLRGSAANAKVELGDETWAQLKAYKRWAHWKNVKPDNLKFEIFKAMNNE